MAFFPLGPGTVTVWNRSFSYGEKHPQTHPQNAEARKRRVHPSAEKRWWIGYPLCSSKIVLKSTFRQAFEANGRGFWQQMDGLVEMLDKVAQASRL